MKDLYRIGIDPGATGAIVVMCNHNPIEWAAMPTMKVGSATRVNCAELAAILRPFRQAHTCVESVHAMPRQGVASSFSFGASFGAILGVLGALEMPHTLVTPQAWKKTCGLIGTDKDAARARAISLWPAWRELGSKGKGCALADAALIACFGG